jgi:hypothetical protein
MAVKAVRERLSTLQQALVTEADVLDRAFAVSVGTRELYDTILDASRTVELYTSLGSTNIRVAAWSKPEPITGVQFFATDKPEVALPTDTFEMRSRPLQRYRADASNGGAYLVSSMEYLVLNTPSEPSPTTQPRMFILFRISQTPTQQYGDIMQLHEYITFYRGERIDRVNADAFCMRSGQPVCLFNCAHHHTCVFGTVVSQLDAKQPRTG